MEKETEEFNESEWLFKAFIILNCVCLWTAVFALKSHNDKNNFNHLDFCIINNEFDNADNNYAGIAISGEKYQDGTPSVDFCKNRKLPTFRINNISDKL